ncbi:MAG TPA: SDR family oxidoreductase, partial [Myxococcota bacterium]|nr:SDR family oxidoreductase [Myxococcota bacterium]
LDFVVHAVASAKREELSGSFLQTSRDGFALAMDVSCYSLIALARHAAPLLAASKHNPSILTLSYIGAKVVVPSYNVMGVAKAALEATVRYLAVDLGPRGVRVNALSAGPVRTLSAAGIHGLREMLACVERESPLRRNIDIDDVGRAALAPLSALGSAMTGETIFVDSGYHLLGGGAWASATSGSTS